MHHTILYVSLPSLHPCNMKLHILALWSQWTQHKSCLFPLLNLDTVLSDSTLENSANIFQMKWNWIRSMKFEAVRIVTFSVICHPKVLLPWQCDVVTSPLYNPRYKTPLKLCPDCMTVCCEWETLLHPLQRSTYTLPTQTKREQKTVSLGQSYSWLVEIYWKLKKRGK